MARGFRRRCKGGRRSRTWYRGRRRWFAEVFPVPPASSGKSSAKHRRPLRRCRVRRDVVAFKAASKGRGGGGPARRMRRRDAGGRWFPGLFPALRPALGGIRKASRPLLGKRVLRQAAVARLDPPGNAATPGPRPGRDAQGRALGRRPGAARAPVSEGPPPAYLLFV